MRRREFIGILGGAVLVWPRTGHAQQRPVIGVLAGGEVAADGFRIVAMRRGLAEQGFVEGQSASFEYRWANNQYERLAGLAADLASRQVSVIVAIGNAAARAAKSATASIPIVFETGDDPVHIGLVSSLARPGGNLTGVTFLAASLVPKEFELLRETVPQADTLGFLENPGNPNTARVQAEVRAAASASNKDLVIVTASTERDFEAAFDQLARRRVGGLLVRSDLLFNSRPKQLAALAAQYKLPAVFPLRSFAEAGGLMSYGGSLIDAMHQVGIYTGRVLKGEKPADLPVHQATKIDLVVNLKAAKALGIEVPQNILARADEVIE